MPEDHFTEEQIDMIKALFTQQVNSLFVKIVAGNIIAMLGIAATIGVGWYRLGHVETQVATVVKAISEGPRFTQEEGDALADKSQQADADLQRQIDLVNKRFDRIETKLDILIQRP